MYELFDSPNPFHLSGKTIRMIYLPSGNSDWTSRTSGEQPACDNECVINQTGWFESSMLGY